VSALHINYGQPNCIREQTAAASIAEHYGIPLRQISIVDVAFAGGYIAARNAALLCLALMLSGNRVRLIALGIHADTPYADCSPEFVRLMQEVFNLYEHGRTRIMAPFLTWTKSEIFDYAHAQGVPLHLAYSSNPDYFQREILQR
jgi:7-cyano-7-deazaguanine synthase